MHGIRIEIEVPSHMIDVEKLWKIAADKTTVIRLARDSVDMSIEATNRKTTKCWLVVNADRAQEFIASLGLAPDPAVPS
jgi:hypothetical protein